ncbi:MAG: alpha-mannosidase [Prevotella sp.]|jgi:alpha-mannosidase|nr:alpha-mannosidase [Prevotella sp.]
MKRLLLNLILFFILIGAVYSQKAYFVDGYHGGIYGHYPMWQTQFMVDKLTQHPEWRIGIEIEPETWDSVKVKEPSAYEAWRKIVMDKRIDFTNPTYAQPYCYNISGESLIRQFEYGIRKIHEHFPDVTFTTYSVEEPCFTSSLPQILKSFGFKYAVLKNPDTCWGGYTRAYGGELVNWIGPDGTSMLTVPRYACEELEENSTWQTKAWNNSESYLKACFDYGIKNPAGMCYQDAGWKNGPWLGYGDKIRNNSTYVTWTDYIENISIGKTDDDWRFSQEDILVDLMWGSQVLQRIAQEVRVSENKIVMAEKIASMVNIEKNYQMPESIDDAWRTLMMAQHHDSWIVPYNRLNKHRTWAEEITLWTGNTNKIADEVINAAIDQYDSKKRDNNGLGYVRVFNTLGISRSELVTVNLPQGLNGRDIAVYDAKTKKVVSVQQTDKNTSRLVFEADIPPFGYSTYLLKDREGKETGLSGITFSESGECVIENDMYRITFDVLKGGRIKSLISKKLGNKEFIDPNNTYGLGELRGFFYEDNRFYSSMENPVRITQLKDNALEKSILIEGEIASHPFTQIVTITKGQPQIDMDLTIDWEHNVGIGEYKQGDNWRDNRRAFHDDRFKLNIMFPVKLDNPQLYKNAPFDVCESRLENTFYNTWDSIKHNIILNWIDLVDKDEKYGFALLSDHTTSYSYGQDFPLGLTAQYSGKGLWGPDYKITRPLKMKYAIIPHTGNWDKANISAESNKWNEPLSAYFMSAIDLKDKSFINVHDSGYEIAAVKAEGNDLLVRLFNAEGSDSLEKITFNFPVKAIHQVELNGKAVSTLKMNKNSISISMPRFGIRTFRIEKQ